MTALPPAFFARPPVLVAPDLLGCLLVREWAGERLAGRVVEVEAYGGAEDAASHAHRGPTDRNRVMFGPAGHAYVYFIYGMHFCLNAVTGQEGEASAVLIRAVEPAAGIETMRRRRGQNKVQALCNGPGKLCQALAIDRALNGLDLTLGSGLWLESGPRPSEGIVIGPRLGVRGDAAALAAPWRFWLAGNPFVSRAVGAR
jgi:DNA-3-methyladenine glycosylase